jgi:hypothetical protein
MGKKAYLVADDLRQRGYENLYIFPIASGV